MAGRIIALLLGWSALSAVSPAPQNACGLPTLNGQYVFVGQGIIEPLEPGVERRHYGVFVFDGRGALSGKQSSSRGGKIGREALEGTYTLAADCSGTITFHFAGRPDTDTHWDMYVTQDGKTGHILRMDAGTMAVRTFQR